MSQSICLGQKCLCLTSYDNRICFGRLTEKQPHDDLFNTHRLCLDGEPMEINAADAYYFAKGCIEVIQDISKNNLYDPCKEVGIDNPIKGLYRKLVEGG